MKTRRNESSEEPVAAARTDASSESPAVSTTEKRSTSRPALAPLPTTPENNAWLLPAASPTVAAAIVSLGSPGAGGGGGTTRTVNVRSTFTPPWSGSPAVFRSGLDPVPTSRSR